jgi:splicing factor 3B subunit 2
MAGPDKKKDPEAIAREKKQQKKKARRERAQQEKKEAPEKERQKEIARLSGLEEKGDDDEDVEYVPAQIGLGDDPAVAAFAEIFEKFKVEEPKEEVKDEPAPKPDRSEAKKAARAKLADDESASSDSDDDGPRKISKRKKKEMSRMNIATLKAAVKRPDVIESWDTSSTDAKLLVYLKAYRNTVPVPKHWSAKRRYMANKRGYEKPPFKLPEYIEQTGIAKIREAVMEKAASQTMKGKQREKVRPKAGKMDIDYQVLHDAFFKYSTKPVMSRHGEVYWEGKENEIRMQNKKPGQLSDTLKNALGMVENGPPPWLINMQRYGPPPSYPSLKIPGLNAPIPSGATYGYHPGGWGKPPVNEYGQPLYGTYEEPQDNDEKDMLWGEVEELDEEDEEEDDDMDADDGAATPAMGTQTPFGVDTPMVSMGSDGGVNSISGVSSVTSGMDTPMSSSTRKRGVQSVSGISSATMTPQPQLFQVLEEQKTKGTRGQLFPSDNTYRVGGRATPAGASTPHGISTPLAGISTPIAGISTPLAGISTPIAGISTPIGGISTPIGGIGTPIGGISTPAMGGISTPIGGIATPVGGIATPVGGIATPVGGIATPVGGIATPVGGIATPVGGIATPVGGIATPVGGIATPVGGIATPQGVMSAVGGIGTPAQGVQVSLNPDAMEQDGIMTADIIRQQLKQHEDAAARARAGAHQKAENERKRKGAKDKSKQKKFKF